jgi:hypothetical protein
MSKTLAIIGTEEAMRSARFAALSGGLACVVLMLAFGAAEATVPRNGRFDPDNVGVRVSRAPNGDFGSSFQRPSAMQFGASGCSLGVKRRWPEQAHGWGKLAVYGLEFAGAEIVFVGCLAAAVLGTPDIESPSPAGLVLLPLSPLLSAAATWGVGRMLGQHGDYWNSTIGYCLGIPFGAIGGVVAANTLKGVPAYAVGVTFSLLPAVFAVVGYNAPPRPVSKQKH